MKLTSPQSRPHIFSHSLNNSFASPFSSLISFFKIKIVSLTSWKIGFILKADFICFELKFSFKLYISLYILIIFSIFKNKSLNSIVLLPNSFFLIISLLTLFNSSIFCFALEMSNNDKYL